MIGFIGCGNMGGTLAAVAAKSIGGENVFVADHNEEKLTALHDVYGCVPVTASRAAESEVLFIGVKPQALSSLSEELKNILASLVKPPLVVSMLAGVTAKDVSEALGGVRVLRIMPNTPAAVGAGVILYCCGEGVTIDDEAYFLRTMKEAGVCVKLPEDKIDMGCAVTGCGPAFVCLLMEAMIDAGVRCGLPRDKAALFVQQTFIGTAKLAQETKTEPATLRAAVCSPAGSTIEGVAALERYGARNAILEAVAAAYERTIEMGRKLP